MKVLYLNYYKWLLPQTQLVRNDFVDYDGNMDWLSISNLLRKN